VISVLLLRVVTRAKTRFSIRSGKTTDFRECKFKLGVVEGERSKK